MTLWDSVTASPRIHQESLQAGFQGCATLGRLFNPSEPLGLHLLYLRMQKQRLIFVRLVFRPCVCVSLRAAREGPVLPWERLVHGAWTKWPVVPQAEAICLHSLVAWPFPLTAVSSPCKASREEFRGPFLS